MEEAGGQELVATRMNHSHRTSKLSILARSTSGLPTTLKPPRTFVKSKGDSSPKIRAGKHTAVTEAQVLPRREGIDEIHAGQRITVIKLRDGWTGARHQRVDCGDGDGSVLKPQTANEAPACSKCEVGLYETSVDIHLRLVGVRTPRVFAKDKAVGTNVVGFEQFVARQEEI